MEQKAFGAFIAQLRKEQNMTQSQLAEKLHVTDKAVSKWETGRGMPDIGNLEALGEVLGVTVTELLQCKKQEEPVMRVEEVESVLDLAFELARYKRNEARRKMLWGFVFTAAGLLVLLAGIRYYLSPAISIIGGADGPTSVFVAAKLSSKVPITLMASGGVLLAGGLWKLFRKKN